MKEKSQLTALIIVLNGERSLDECLNSLSFCEHIVIIDSFSTDRTKEIALKHQAIFIENKFVGYKEQIQFGIDWICANLPSEWIFFLDCDEICSLELKNSIENILGNNDIFAYQICRRTWYYNKFLSHGGMYPDKLYRLFKPNGIRISEKNGHPTYLPTKSHGQLAGDLLHYSYSSFANQMEKLNIYATRGASSMRADGKKAGLLSAILHAKWRFIHTYLFKAGFLDGKAGFILAIHLAFYTFLKYLRIDEGNWGKPYVQSLTEINETLIKSKE